MEEPLYKKIAEELRNRIKNQTYPPGFRMPGHTRIASEFGVSSITSNRALRELMNEKLIERHERMGSFVCKTRKLSKVTLISHSAPQNYPYMQGCMERCTSLGIEANTYIIKHPFGESEFSKLPIGNGIVYVVVTGKTEFCMYSDKNKIPNVFVGIENPECFCVTVNFRDCARDLAKTMAEDGCRRTGFIGNLSSINHILSRNGYLEGTAPSGIGFRYIRDATTANLNAVIRDLLADDLSIDSLIISGGHMPIAALPEIYSIKPGLKLGFICENSSLTLLSPIAYLAHFSMEDTGKAAIDMLSEIYSGTLTIPETRYMPYRILRPCS
ncbi:MAG: hypothetical protein A2017_14995 [Lentisphaerae bacterium GWF2_44_16]|nr:MAG: hypothetical protein A2017_14995 [Lentisphaerae bacterium GWF2_44_16]